MAAPLAVTAPPAVTVAGQKLSSRGILITTFTRRLAGLRGVKVTLDAPASAGYSASIRAEAFPMVPNGITISASVLPHPSRSVSHLRDCFGVMTDNHTTSNDVDRCTVFAHLGVAQFAPSAEAVLYNHRIAKLTHTRDLDPE
jgi:hypothetical protein